MQSYSDCFYSLVSYFLWDNVECSAVIALWIKELLNKRFKGGYAENNTPIEDIGFEAPNEPAWRFYRDFILSQLP
jgi:hypothetical protein